METKADRDHEMEVMARNRVKVMRVFGRGTEPRKEIQFDPNGHRQKSVDLSWGGRMETLFDAAGRKKEATMISPNGKTLCTYRYEYDENGNMIGEIQEKDGELWGTFVHEYGPEGLETKFFKNMGAPVPDGGGEPAFDGHNDKWKFVSKRGRILEQTCDAWASTANGGHVFTRRFAYDEKGNVLETSSSSKPRIKRDDDPNPGSETNAVYEYDANGLLKAIRETRSESGGLQPVGASNQAHSRFEYEFFPARP